MGGRMARPLVASRLRRLNRRRSHPASGGFGSPGDTWTPSLGYDDSYSLAPVKPVAPARLSHEFFVILHHRFTHPLIQ